MRVNKTVGCTVTFCMLVFLAPAIWAGQDWVEFVDQTPARIVADPTLGSADPFEKDLAIGDLDRDGDIDLVVVRKVRFSFPGGQPNVLFMNENGVMVDRTADLIPGFNDLTDDRDVIIVDVNGDDWLDIITATTFANQPRLYMNLGNDPNGLWQGFDYNPAENRIAAFDPPPKFCAVAAGDVNGDNSPDLFFVDYNNNLEDRLLINDGNGFFTDETDSRMTPAMSNSAFGTAAEIFDINGDGFNDLIKCDTLGGNPDSIRVIYNDGTGHFDFMQIVSTDLTYMQATGDFNNDGRLDIYVVGDQQDHYLLNLGNDTSGHATFQNRIVLSSPATTDFGGNIRLADMDEDGFLDVVVSDVDTDEAGCNRRLTLLQNQGDTPGITLMDPLNGANRPWLPNGTFDTAVFDMDGDGKLDIWAGTCDGNRVFMGVAECAAPVIVAGEAGTGFDVRAFDGFIDARAESTNGVDVDLGLDSITMEFSTPIRNLDDTPLSAEAFSISDPAGTAPSITGISTEDGTVVTINLDGPIAVQQYTTIHVTAAAVCASGVIIDDTLTIGYLPADVNQDGCVTPFDLLQFRIFVNGGTPEVGVSEDFVDTNRDGGFSPLDLLAFRQLVNGVSPSTRPWTGECLP